MMTAIFASIFFSDLMQALAFEEYRRDSEDGRGWFPIGGYGDARFASEVEALAQARESVAWLKLK